MSLPASNADAYTLGTYYGEIVRAVQLPYPNAKLMLLDWRIYAGYAHGGGPNPEPYAYESGLPVKSLIQAQVNQVRTGIVDPLDGDLNYQAGMAPWLAWANTNGPMKRCPDVATT